MTFSTRKPIKCRRCAAHLGDSEGAKLITPTLHIVEASKLRCPKCGLNFDWRPSATKKTVAPRV